MSLVIVFRCFRLPITLQPIDITTPGSGITKSPLGKVSWKKIVPKKLATSMHASMEDISKKLSGHDWRFHSSTLGWKTSFYPLRKDGILKIAHVSMQASSSNPTLPSDTCSTPHLDMANHRTTHKAGPAPMDMAVARRHGRRCPKFGWLEKR